MTNTNETPGDGTEPQPAPQYPPPAGYQSGAPYAGQPYAPQPMLESEARTMSMLTHLLTLLVGIVSPLIFWLVYKDRSALVDHHGKEQLNFQISLIIYSVGVMVLSFVTFGIGALLYMPLAIFALVVIIMAAVAANRGEYYKIPLNIRFIS